jgi:chromosome segregation ATPase
MKMNKAHIPRTPDRFNTDHHNSENYLRSKLNDAYSELENLKSVFKDIKTVDKSGYENDYLTQKRSTSSLRSGSVARKTTSSTTPIPHASNKSRYTYEAINQFKDTLKETEKYIGSTTIDNNVPRLSPTRMTRENILLSSPKSYLSGLHTPNRFRTIDTQYPSLTDHYGKYSLNAVKDESEKINMSNHLLNRNNVEMKNQVKLMQMELDTYKNNAKFANGYFDQNINEYVESMKSTLSACQYNNKEYQELIDRLQKQNIDMSGEVALYKEQAEFSKRELDVISKKYESLKRDYESIFSSSKCIGDEKVYLEIQINERDAKIADLSEKLNCFVRASENQSKSRGEGNALIESLNATIEFLRKTQTSYDQEKVIMKQTIEEQQNEIIRKNYDLEALSEKINLCSKDKHFYFSEIDMIRSEYKNNHKYLEDLQVSYKKLLSDLEKERNRRESTEINLEEKEQIIENLKKTVSHITKSLEEFKEENDRFKANNDVYRLEHSKLIKNIEITELKLKDINVHFNELTVVKEQLHRGNLELERELNDKKSKLSQIEFEYGVEKQRADEFHILINRLKEENKSLKIANVENAYSLENTKKHEEVLTKINNLNIEISAKNTEIINLKSSYEDQLRFKSDEIKKLTMTIRDYQSDNRDKEFRSEVIALHEEVERITREFKRRLEEVEEQKLLYQRKYEKLNSEYEILQASYDRLDIEFKQNGKDKRRSEDHERELSQNRQKCEKLQSDLNAMEFEYKKALKDRKLIEEYEEEKQIMNRKYAELAAELDKLIGEQKKAFKEIKRIEELEYEITVKNKKIEQLQGELDNLEVGYKKVKASSKKVQDIEGDNIQLLKKFDKLQDDYNKINEDYKLLVSRGKKSDDFEYEKISLQKKYDTLSNDFDRLSTEHKKCGNNRNKLEDYEYEMSSLRKQYDKLLVDYKNLTSEYNQNRNGIADSDYRSICTKYEKLQKDFNNLDSQHFGCAKEIASKTKIISALQAQIDDLLYQEKKKSTVVMCQEAPKVYYYDNQKEIETRVEYKTSSKVVTRPQVDFSQINCKFTGSEWLLAIFDNTRVLAYNLKSQKFDLIKFSDKEYKFQMNYVQEGSLCLNDKDGLFIVTGTNFDQLYYYSHSEASMSYIAQLRINHMNGGLVIDGFRNTLICLSGSKTNTVEKYSDLFIKGYYSFEGRNSYMSKQWTNMPELKYDRANAGYVIVNDCVYAMFGYSNTQKRYIESIERLSLASGTQWEEVKFALGSDISLQLKSFASVEDSDNSSIIIFGGQDGSGYKSNRVTLTYNYLQNTLTSNNSFTSSNALFSRSTGLVPFYMDGTFSFAGYDDNNKAFLIEPSKSRFGVYSYP